MIHLVLGKQGEGKTIYLCKVAFDFYKKGKTVYSNIALNFPYEKLNYQDIIDCKLKDGVVILDEIHLLLPARMSMRKININICDGFLSMCRKKQLDVYGSTQLSRKVDVRFREESDYIYVCEKLALLNKKLVKIMHNQNLEKEIDIYIKLDITETYSGNMITKSFKANKYFDMYNTKEIIKIEGI